MARPRCHYYKRGKYFYLRLDGQRRSLGVTNEAEAKRMVAEILKRRSKARFHILDPSRCTLKDFTRRYLDHRRSRNLSPRTITHDEKALKSLSSLLGEEFLISRVRARQVEQWISALHARGRSPHTVKSYLSHLLPAFKTAVKWGLMSAMPDLERYKTPKLLPRAPKRGELDKVLAQEPDPEIRAAITLYFWLGARLSELCALTADKVHASGPEPYLVLYGKGAKECRVPLMPEALAALEVFGPPQVGHVLTFAPRVHPARPSDANLADMLKSHSKMEVGHMLGVSDSIVGRWARTPYPARRRITPGHLSRLIKRAFTRAGLGHFHTHHLRHALATWLAEKGVPAQYIKEIMRHESITTTMRYVEAVTRVPVLRRAMNQATGRQDD